MQITPLLNAMMGVQRGMQSLRRDAAQIASAAQMRSGDANGLAAPLTHLAQDRLQVAAAAKAVRSVDEALGSLLDEHA